MCKRFRYSEGYRIDGFVVGNENELGSECDDEESEESDSRVQTRYKDTTGRDHLSSKWIARKLATPKGVKAFVKVKQEAAATSISKHGIDINNIRVANSEIYKKDDRNDSKTYSPKHNTEFEDENLNDSEATTIVEDTSEFEISSESESDSEDEKPGRPESRNIKPAASKATIVTQAKTEALPAKSSMFKQSVGLKRTSQIIVQPSDDARFNEMVESFNPSMPKRADQGHAAKKRRTV